MSTIDWVIIIAEVVLLIAKGLPKDDAVSQVAAKFGVSERDIWSHGGF
jgi:hypothetical protein